MYEKATWSLWDKEGFLEVESPLRRLVALQAKADSGLHLLPNFSYPGAPSILKNTYFGGLKYINMTYFLFGAPHTSIEKDIHAKPQVPLHQAHMDVVLTSTTKGTNKSGPDAISYDTPTLVYGP